MVLHRIKGSVCYNEMIHQEHSKILQQILQFSGHGHVLPGGAVQPAGMIMCQNDPFKSAAHTKLRHLSGSHRHLGQRAAAQLLAADQGVGGIQVEQQQAFLRASQQPCTQVLSTLDGGGQHRPLCLPTNPAQLWQTAATTLSIRAAFSPTPFTCISCAMLACSTPSRLPNRRISSCAKAFVSF